jgi:dihydrodipicolinate synthase/N-acetylneuraminate lyase
LTVLSGLVPILATPFHPDGSLDRASLERLVEFQLAAGAAGIAVFGMASETFALDTEERALVLESIVTIVRRQDGSLPVVVGIAPTGLAPALEQARHAVDAGANVLMVLPPFLVPAPSDQLAGFYGQLATKTGVPIMVQDAPAATGVAMGDAVITELADLPGVEYVKIEAQPTAPKIDRVARAVGDRLRVFGGQNSQFLLEELERGAVGTMPACELTDFLGDVIAARQAGDVTSASEQFTRLLPLLIYGLQNGIAWAVHKEILVRRGIIASACVRSPAVALDRASYEGLVRALGPFEKESSWHVG